MTALSVCYQIMKELYQDEDHSYITYGIAVYAISKQTKEATPLSVIHDITTDEQRLLSLIEQCNALELSLIHLPNVIEDFLLG